MTKQKNKFKPNTQIQKKQVFERLIIIKKKLKVSIYKTSCGTVALYGSFFFGESLAWSAKKKKNKGP